jgi:dephospho-CoA kinase
VILVTADRRTQLKRLVERDGLSRAAAQQRIAAQLPLAAKKRHADYLIDGTQPFEAVAEQVRTIYDELKRIKTSD